MSVSIDGSGSITGIDQGFNVTGGVQVGTGATINGSTNIITALTTGSERIRVTSNGDVGIGTTVPTSKLTVVGNINVTGTVSVGGTLTYEDVTSIDSVGIITAQSGVHVTSGNVGIGTDNPISTLQIKAGGEERVFLTTTGRVGLGLTTPATQLGGSKNAQFAGVYNGIVEASVNNNSGLILLHKLGQNQGFYFAGDIIVMSWTGQAKIDCILSAKYNNDQLGWNVRDNGTGGTNMVSKTTVKFGTVTYDSGTWVCIKKDGGGTGVVRLNGYISSNAESFLPNGHQTIEITSGYSSFSSSATLN